MICGFPFLQEHSFQENHNVILGSPIHQETKPVHYWSIDTNDDTMFTI